MKTFKLTITDDNEWVYETTEDYCGNVTRSLTLGSDAGMLAKATRILSKHVNRAKAAEAANGEP